MFIHVQITTITSSYNTMYVNKKTLEVIFGSIKLAQFP